MSDLFDLRNHRRPKWASPSAGNPHDETFNPRGNRPVSKGRRLRRSNDSARFLLKVAQYVFLVLALVFLGNVTFEYTHSKIFQYYQSWRFDQVTNHQSNSKVSLLMRWIDQALAKAGYRSPSGVQATRSNDDASDLARRESRPLTSGALLGRMEIPNLDISVMVLEGDDDNVLAKAAGHVPNTAFPGGAGNVVIAAHRDTFFRALRNIKKNDEITFTTTRGIYHYLVQTTDKVKPEEVKFLQATSRPTLTLITCYPFYFIGSAPKRFIVQAWQTPSIQPGVPNEVLAGAGSPLDSPSVAPPAPSPQLKPTHSDSSPPPSGSTSTLVAATVTRNAPVTESSGSALKAAETRQADRPAASPSTSQEIYGRVRAWFGSVTSRLSQN